MYRINAQSEPSRAVTIVMCAPKEGRTKTYSIESVNPNLHSVKLKGGKRKKNKNGRGEPCLTRFNLRPPHGISGQLRLLAGQLLRAGPIRVALSLLLKL
ncbi:hypothetical protein LR48_Vigan08g078600 [Vigna angularis]|uniref:Uncharacterized protein n=1 Tax=Phaseolus angularis TaxID=3914 RepID=A0A0L9V5M4_PHAAN|nr:hypothetical protein LR48_Vigan08g078600 [Vigna angularis]